MSREGDPKTGTAEVEGTGSCPEAQADGVPCEGTENNCLECDRAGRPSCLCPPSKSEATPSALGSCLDRAGM